MPYQTARVDNAVVAGVSSTVKIASKGSNQATRKRRSERRIPATLSQRLRCGKRGNGVGRIVARHAGRSRFIPAVGKSRLPRLREDDSQKTGFRNGF